MTLETLVYAVGGPLLLVVAFFGHAYLDLWKRQSGLRSALRFYGVNLGLSPRGPGALGGTFRGRECAVSIQNNTRGPLTVIELPVAAGGAFRARVSQRVGLEPAGGAFSTGDREFDRHFFLRGAAAELLPSLSPDARTQAVALAARSDALVLEKGTLRGEWEGTPPDQGALQGWISALYDLACALESGAGLEARAFEDPDQGVREAALALLLADEGRREAAIARALAGAQPPRLRLAAALAAQPPDWRALVALAEDTQAGLEVRRGALEGLPGETPAGALVAALEAALASGERALASAAARRVAGATWDAAARERLQPGLLVLLGHSSLGAKLAALDGLAAAGDTRALAAVGALRAAERSDRGLRDAAARAEALIRQRSQGEGGALSLAAPGEAGAVSLAGEAGALSLPEAREVPE